MPKTEGPRNTTELARVLRDLAHMAEMGVIADLMLVALDEGGNTIMAGSVILNEDNDDERWRRLKSLAERYIAEAEANTGRKSHALDS